MKQALVIGIALALTGCTEASNDAQQAEIERLQAETEKLRAETQQLETANAQQAALSSISYTQAARCALLTRYFRDREQAFFTGQMSGLDARETDVSDFLNGAMLIARRLAGNKAETMNPRPDVESDTGVDALFRLNIEIRLSNGGMTPANLYGEFRSVCRPILQSEEFLERG